MSVIWASLPFDQVRSVGDCLLADNDIDDYMAFRAVCHDWRSATKDGPAKAKAGDDTDPAARFIPTKWALLSRSDDLVTLINVNTGRFLYKRIPVLRQFSFVGATSGGLILLEDSAEPPPGSRFEPLVVVEFAGDYGSLEGFFRPFTLAQVITDHCKSINYSKLYEMMMLSKWGIWDNLYDDSESDESSSSELDDEESSSSEHDDDEASSSEPADD